MTREEAFLEINKMQDNYVEELVNLINNDSYKVMKEINFTSATGTGKTKMIAKLINKLPDFYFIITTLSKGQLHHQVEKSIKKDCPQGNFLVYGSCDYKINSKIKANDIISQIPEGVKCIWIRDEGHIRTNRFEQLLKDFCFKVINFSATNVVSDITCDFSQTMMLRTVNQLKGTPKDAITKLLEIKKVHKNVKGYNPCAIFRCVAADDNLYNNIISLCRKNNLKYIDITEDSFVMEELCKDDNEYDVIINKFKLVEGIDIRRAHILYMDNQPANNITTIQAIGRCRRNALLYRDDVDIFALKNKELLESTRECYVFYNVENMKIDTDINGELQYAFCNYISCQLLKPGFSIEVNKGQLFNGLYIIELLGKTGKFNISIDDKTGFNVIEPDIDFYNTIVEDFRNYIYMKDSYSGNYEKIKLKDIYSFPLKEEGGRKYYDLCKNGIGINEPCQISEEAMGLFNFYLKKYSKTFILNKIKNNCLDFLLDNDFSYNINDIIKMNRKFLILYKYKKRFKQFCKIIKNINMHVVEIAGEEIFLKNICEKNELEILSYFCIKKKLDGFSIEDILNYVKNYIYIKFKFISNSKYFDDSLSLLFNESNLSNYTIFEMRKIIADFYQENFQKDGYKIFCDVLYGMENHNLNSFIGDINKFCTENSLLKIQLYCILDKKKRLTNNVIFNKIKEIFSSICISLLKEINCDWEKFSFLILDRDIIDVKNYVFIDEITINSNDVNIMKKVEKEDITKFFKNINDKVFFIDKILFFSSTEIMGNILSAIQKENSNLNNNIVSKVKYDFSIFFNNINYNDISLSRNHFLYLSDSHNLFLDQLKNAALYKDYKKIVNDRESSIIGVDLMQQIKKNDEIIWVESKSVTSKISKNTKFGLFLHNKYKKELEEAKGQLFSGVNNFNLDKRYNAILGYCVEYYSKYLLFGEAFLKHDIIRARREGWCYDKDVINDSIIIRACMFKYKKMMAMCFGDGVKKVIKTISLDKLIDDDYFKNLVVELGKKTAEYVKGTLYKNELPENNIEENLSIKHISGLADYITSDTILDVKVKNCIDEASVLQVLAYHYLSTKRTDLSIKRVIVYDAVKGKTVTINISKNNIVDWK